MSGDKFTLSVTILLTGFAVVFSVLLILIGVIKLYGTVIYHLQNKSKEKKAAAAVATAAPSAPAASEAAPVAVVEAVSDDDELIAVISAAVYSMYSSSEVRIRRIRKATQPSAAWRTAGLSDNTRPF